MPLDGIRRAILPWVATHDRNRLAFMLTSSELFRLGLTAAPVTTFDPWGASSRARVGCLCLRMPSAQPQYLWRGHPSAGILMSAVADLNLRATEFLSELHMPAVLLPHVLRAATSDLADRAVVRYPDDLRGISDYVHRLSADDVEQYLGPVDCRRPSGAGSCVRESSVNRWTFLLAAVVAAMTVVRAQVQTPAITITSPSEDVVVIGAAHLSAAISPAVPVERVSFFADGRMICEPQQPPYGCNWDAGSAVRSHHIRVVAYLTDGRRLVASLHTKDVGYTERVDVDAIQVPVVVTSGGAFVKGLKKADFTIAEDGVAQPIASVASEDMPLDLVVAIDISGSMAPALDDVKRAVKQLLSKLRPGRCRDVDRVQRNHLHRRRARDQPARP